MTTNNNNSNDPVGITRRDFIGQASCAALGTTGLLSTLMNLQMANKVVSAGRPLDDDYKALVCVFLNGGNDSYNMLVPTTPDEYSQYAYVRDNLAHSLPGSGAANAMHALNALETDGRSFAVHPAMPEVQQLFNQGTIAFMANVGTLIQPTTVHEYRNKLVPLPKAIGSHKDQVMQWQSSIPQSVSATGWAGRMADILTDPVNQDGVSMNISLGGNNLFQTGDNTTFYSITTNGSVSLKGKDDPEASYNHLRYFLAAGEEDEDENSLVGQLYRNLFQQSYIDEVKNSVDLDRVFSRSFEANQVNESWFTPGNRLSQNLKAVAQTIASRNDLNMRRQVFFVVMGGFDMHQELLVTQNGLLRIVSEAFNEFWNCLGDLGVQDDVLTFTASDFGRTLRSNGRGTDHAWAGHQMVMGGAPLRGQRIHGRYPGAGELALGSGLDVGNNGRMLPTTSVDEYMAEFALWFGAEDNTQLQHIFPNINNFYTYQAGQMPIGILDPAYVTARFDDSVFKDIVSKPGR